MDVVNIAQKFNLIHDYWHPRIVGELNDAYIKLVKLKGEFIWHRHEVEDELFLVVKGTLRILLKDQELIIDEGEFAIIPHGIEHKPVAEEEVEVVLLEPKSTVNTGEVQSNHTVDAGWI